MSQTNEKQVDLDVAAIDELRQIAWQRSPKDLQAVIDRLQVKIFVNEMPRRRRRLYRAIMDYYDEVLEERSKKEGGPPPARRNLLDYVRQIIRGIDD